jgi:hypothetical protein
MMILGAALLTQQAYGEPGEDSETCDQRFTHLSAAASIFHFNDEGSPYRLALGIGCQNICNDLSLLLSTVYSYYEVNHVADNHPSPSVKGGTSHSLGVDLLLRWSLLQTPQVTYHFEFGAGFQSILRDPPFPADGSDENFTVLFGPGITIPAAIHKQLRLSLLWLHISNANLFPNNSGYDGIQLVMGYEW